MEAIDNKCLIVVTSNGTIDATLVDEEATVKDKSVLLKLMVKGCTIITKGWTICNVKDNKSLSETKEIYVDNVTHMFFPATFKSFEQVSISLELFNYYNNREINVWYNFYDEETEILNYATKKVANKRLEEEKRRLEERYEQEYISKKALMLIYSDGKVESVKETLKLYEGDSYHLYYYTKLYKSSPRLRKMMPNFIPYTEGTIDTGHNSIDNLLVNNNAAVFLNQDIGVPKKLRTHPLSFFHTLLPKDYGSIMQTEKIEEILKKYPEYRMHLGSWNEEEKRCETTYLTNVLQDIVIKKELIRKEGK